MILVILIVLIMLMIIMNEIYNHDEIIDIEDEMMVTRMIHRLPRVGTRKTRRRRRPRTANSKVESCQKKPKGAVANSPKLRSQNACLKPFYRGRILIQAL